MVRLNCGTAVGLTPLIPQQMVDKGIKPNRIIGCAERKEAHQSRTMRLVPRYISYGSCYEYSQSKQESMESDPIDYVFSFHYI